MNKTFKFCINLGVSKIYDWTIMGQKAFYKMEFNASMLKSVKKFFGRAN